MIVRIVKGRVSRDDVGEANAAMRSFVDQLRVQPGLVYAKLGRRLLPGGGEELLLFEEWLTPADLARWTGGRLDAIILPDGIRPRLEGLDVMHYEALDRLPAEPDHAWPRGEPDVESATASAGDKS